MPAKKKKKKKKSRFPFFRILLLLILVGGAVYGGLKLKEHFAASASTGIARESLYGSYYTGTMVIAREETLYETENKTSIDFVAGEGSHVSRGSTICTVYASGYNATEVTKLQTYREEIQAYHTNQVFSSYVDAALENENSVISNLATQVRSLVRGRGSGSLSNLEKQLSSELTARKNYLKQKYPDDQNLSELYKVENDQMKKIESWTNTYNASEDCMVSFYTDGYEDTVNANTYSNLMPSDIRTVIRGGSLDDGTTVTGKEPIFRTVSEDVWYGLFLCTDKEFNPAIGDVYQIQLDGFGDEMIDGTVQSFSRIGGDLLLRLRIDSNVEPVLNIRTCKASVGSYVSGLYVPMRAIYSYNNALGVVVLEGGTQTFVEVTVISYPDKDTAFVRPVLSGSPLTNGKTVQLF